jgi:hypothetical protein
MTLSVNISAAAVNTANPGNNQLGARTVAMRDGGHVVLWQDNPASTSDILATPWAVLS